MISVHFVAGELRRVFAEVNNSGRCAKKNGAGLNLPQLRPGRPITTNK